jgi:hypothetical protein
MCVCVCVCLCVCVCVGLCVSSCVCVGVCVRVCLEDGADLPDAADPGDIIGPLADPIADVLIPIRTDVHVCKCIWRCFHERPR